MQTPRTRNHTRPREEASMRTRLTDLLNIEYPIIQAPMAGGATTVELVAACSQAGALGSLGAAYLSPEQISATAATIREQTRKPFAINLFATVPAQPVTGDTDRMLALLAGYSQALDIPAPRLPEPQPDPLAAQIAAVLQVRPAVFSFTFGLIPETVLAQCRELGILTIGTATTVREAMALADAGVDAVVAQGAEAGGHRATFLDAFEASLIGTMALTPQIVDAVSVPVIASGGIMDGRGLAAALMLGAAAAQLGTAFLTTDEAGIPDAYKDAIRATQAEQTKLTRAYSGRPARGIVNAFMSDAEALAEHILPYPLQNALTRAMRTAGGKQHKLDVMSLWAGQGAGLAQREPAAALLQRLVREAQTALGQASKLC